MFQLFRNKLFRRQFLSNFAIIFLTFSAIALILLLFTRDSLRQQQLQIVDRYRRTVAQSLNGWIAEKKNDLEDQALFLEHLDEADLKSQSLRDMLRQQLIRDSSLDVILIVDRRGGIINSTRDVPRDLVKEQFPMLNQRLRNGSSLFSGIIRTSNQAQMMLISVPLHFKGQPAYLLGEIIRLSTFARMIDDLKIGALGHAYLVNQEGQIITQNMLYDYIMSGALRHVVMTDSLAVRQLLRKMTGIGIYHDFTGRSVLGSFEWLSAINAGLIVEFPVSQVMKPIFHLLRVILVLVVCVGFLGLCLAYLVSRQTTGHINRLVDAAAHIANQDYQTLLNFSTNTELDILINQFNRMQQAIQAREKNLQEKNLELRTQRAEALEAAKMKSQFLANMSHELRTPLNSIIGFTARVIKKCRDILPPVQLENLEIVHNEARHLLELINDLLDLSKIEAGKMEVHVEPFNLVEVIREIEPMIQPYRTAKPIEYAQLLSDAENIPMTSDRIKVKQILINLLSNAFKYSEKGTVTLSVRREESRIRITVADQGIGIAPENQSAIFDEFRQIDGTYTRKVGGSGLGLSITKNFVFMLQGRIDVASTLGVGSVFTVDLPVVYEEPRPVPDQNVAPQTGPGPEKLKVVCIDDDPDMRRRYREYLDEAVFDLIPLDDGPDVTAQIASLQPQVILLDIILPRKDGWTILAELKDNPATRQIPVIMASVLNEKNLAYQLQADEYLVKPISREELTTALNRAVSDQKHLEVLVADDNANFRNLISQYFREQAIHCRLARDGEEALQMIAARKPDLLLLDIMMPRKDGWAVLDEIGKRPEWDGMTVVVITGKPLSKQEHALLKTRALQICEKSGTQFEKNIAALINLVKEKAVAREEPTPDGRGVDSNRKETPT